MGILLKAGKSLTKWFFFAKPFPPTAEKGNPSGHKVSGENQPGLTKTLKTLKPLSHYPALVNISEWANNVGSTKDNLRPLSLK